MSSPDPKEPGFLGHLAIAFLPVPLWGYGLGYLANADGARAGTTALVVSVAFAAGLLVMKPVVLAFGVVSLAKALWAWSRKQKPGDRFERGAARVIGLLYAPVFGAITLAIGIWDGWDAGGWSAPLAGLAFGTVGFTHAVLVHRSTIAAAIGVLMVTEGNEGDSGGGAERRRVDAAAPVQGPPDTPGEPQPGEMRR